MGRLNLKAEDSTSEVILNYLEANVSDELANKINNGDKTLSQCFNYDLKSNKIRQFYAEHNSKPPADAVTFVNEWAEALKKSRMENTDATCSN